MLESPAPSIVAPSYASGEYYDSHAVYDLDTPYKATELLALLLPYAARRGIKVRSFADVGCGGGGAAEAIRRGLLDAGHPVEDARGYEISPHVTALRKEGVTFHYEDFSQADAHLDLVTMFDVFEHVPDPVGFLRNVAERCHVLGLHIPLDDNWGNGFFNRYRGLMDDPGHVMYLDTASALTLVSMSGVLTQDYRYTYPHRWPSSRTSLAMRLASPLRRVLSFINPWLAYKLVGGVSLMVIGVTPTGLKALR